jgi:hypothetical protein
VEGVRQMKKALRRCVHSRGCLSNFSVWQPCPGIQLLH